MVLSDLGRAKDVNSRCGISSDVLVFPRNHHGYLTEVKAAGIKKVRMPATGGPDPYSNLGTLERAYKAIVKNPTPVVKDKADPDFELHYASELLNWGANPSLLKVLATKRRILKAIDMAKEGQHIHLWLHPFDLVEAPGLFAFVIEVLKLLSVARDRDELEFGVF